MSEMVVVGLSEEQQETVERIRELVEDLGKELVDGHFDTVQVQALVDGRRVTFRMTSREDQLRYLIGGGGDTAKAMRLLLKNAGYRNDLIFGFEVVESFDQPVGVVAR